MSITSALQKCGNMAPQPSRDGGQVRTCLKLRRQGNSLRFEKVVNVADVDVVAPTAMRQQSIPAVSLMRSMTCIDP